MTELEFVKGVRRLESLPPRLESSAERKDRRLAVLEAIGEFDIKVFDEARRAYLQGEENKYFPSPGELRRMCIEILERQRQANEPKLINRFTPQDHEHHDPKTGDALSALAVVWKYESLHVECDGKIKATCPKCGKRHTLVNPTIQQLMAAFPDQTVGWKENHKGMALCGKCEGK